MQHSQVLRLHASSYILSCMSLHFDVLYASFCTPPYHVDPHIAYIVMAYIAMAFIVMACVSMACIVMALYGHGLSTLTRISLHMPLHMWFWYVVMHVVIYVVANVFMHVVMSVYMCSTICS